ncbi:hypothetical protein OSB04_030229 [Centaurea solstitialis]|uniref:Uncharacterized protein n=1 Tax=Centaurea solstitialis TaxID=347529 RepID=A0AA38SK82_9ASTR|nr:hypothetical protein OSB04_030229 [Centaurea solstitialis]
MHQMDVKIDLLNEDLEEIYMEQPKGFVAQDRLMYLMSCTRLDLAYAVSKLSRYTSNASVEYWRSITRLSRYLRYIRECGLHYGRYPTVIKGYSDANWISDIKDSRSTSGYVFILGSATISWKSSKKTIIARSTMESEFIALDKCGEKVEEVGSLRRELTGAQFLKAFTEPGSVHDHNEHDYEDMNLLGRVLCEICKLSTQTTDQFKDIKSTDS